VGAGQTVDQLKLYGEAAKWFVEVGTHEATPQRLRWIRTLACRAWWTATSGRHGPVHLNFPLREPLVLDPGDELPEDTSGRPGGRPWLSRPATVTRLAQPPPAGHRGVVVAGRDERHPDLPEEVARFAQRAGWPLLADPLSRARRGPAAIAHYDALLRDQAFAAAQRPDVVLRVGDLPTSKPLRGWLAAQAEAEQVRVDPEEAWQDPDGVVATMLVADPVETLGALVPGTADPGWLSAWRAADRAATGAIASALGGELSEPRVAIELGAGLPAEVTCFVASSMPIRDAETFWPVRDPPPRALGHRGANGIDGTVSGALGAAAAGDGRAVLFIGDVALAHDLGALQSARRLGLALTIVLIDNDGGGIFHFLPVARERDAFEEHVATPHGLDFAKVAALYDCAYARPEDPAALRSAVDAGLAGEGVSLVHVRTDRERNVTAHRAVWEAVSGALTG
ncbi:MAG TPA: 2-succinyl-5-enolpyruvyl-6-hydroxy-3-cyclohexene-1-carboxylic-acid synthase, partial [Solirubrobacteraceae bacterium]|nr:2-succinyl-5-enolpyruvyl-6-hydroxy-3-cyclohexene-1-carboxylic-acid synthase [Solirubrobacteraceae bacterium]